MLSRGANAGDLEQQRQASSTECTTSASADSDGTTALAHGPGQDGLRPDELTAMLIRFNAHRELQLFQESTYTCLICFEDVPGTQCIRAASCQHFYCCGCLQSHCQTQLAENRIDMLLCPDPKCTEPLHRDVSLPSHSFIIAYAYCVQRTECQLLSWRVREAYA